MGTRSKLVGILAVVALLGAGVGVVMAPPPPGRRRALPMTGSPPCRPDPAAAIDATPPGGTWNGGGACYTTDGIVITASDITVTDATFSDPLTGPPVAGHGFPPVVEIRDTTAVTLSDLTIDGADPTGTYHARLVHEAGIKLVQTTRTRLDGIAVDGTFGDCLEVFAIPPHQVVPNTRLTVDGFTADNCGRMNMTLADVYGAAIRHFTGGNYGYASMVFESDMALGAGDVTVSHSTWGGTIIEEELTGPLLFDHDASGRVIVPGHRTVYPVIFRNGTLTIPKKSNPAGIWIYAGTGAVVFDHYIFARSAIRGAQRALLWKVVPAGHLTITHSTLSGPLGLAGPNVTLVGDSGS